MPPTPDPLRAEHRLIIAATSPRSSRTDIESALAQDPDWAYLVELALHHRLAPALLAVLDGVDSSLIPVDLLDALRLHCQHLRMQSQKIVEETLALLGLLADQNVVAVPFKGPLLAAQIFGDMGLRSPGDVDILLHPSDVGLARQLLEAQGFEDQGGGEGAVPLSDSQRRVYERLQCEYTYARASDDIVVEPHWGLCQYALAIDVDYQGMLARAQPSSYEGHAVLALTPEDQFIALCVHGSKHHWQRLSWVKDVAGLLAQWPDLDLSGLLRASRLRGYSRLLLLALAVSRDFASTRLPAKVRDAIDEDRTLVCLLDDFRRRVFNLTGSHPRNDRIESFRWHLRERWQDRLRYAARTIVSPRRHHLEVVSLHPSLAWAYYPLKIGIDYAIAPMWAVLKRGLDT